ncbi:hypothetical protein H2204_001938 [Knufia peltigerae]|uniref:Carboxylesterase type B domain-containing protein n=1 Tax=Knufia peltigerae TaxID=1002370 RepID=A0AA38YC85_9EURO|nr:hypothetical protein H2204_001938 [Knufia peltigerae]
MAAFVESSNYSHVLQKGAAVVSTLEDRADGPHPSIQTKQVTACRINQLQINGFINQNTGVANFLNVPYARIPARFCEATLIDPRKEIGVIEAVRYGPCCPQPFDVIHDMTGHLYPKKIDITNSSEFACLSVNIYAPPSAVGSRNRLPVTAWIHGGAFTYGDASDEYDGNYIVQHSMSIGKPVIVVTMNYRVGPYGFLTSKEIREESLARGEKGFANQGYHDQRLGLQWIQQNIQFWGGNGYEITAAGESAGACSILTHLRSDFPAFQRAFVMSAAPLTPTPFSHSQERFDALIAKIGLPTGAPAGDKLAALRSLTCDELNKIHGPGVSPPTYDPEFYPDHEEGFSLETKAPLPAWLRGMVVGNTTEEAALFVPRSISGAQAVSMVKKAFGGDADLCREVLALYDIKADDDTPGSGTDGVVRLATHATFGQMAQTIASGHHSEVPLSLYSFEQRDPFPGSPWKGRAFHSLGNAMLFRLPTVAGPDADPGTRLTSDKFSEALISLTNGEQPWEVYDGEGRKKMVFDGERSGLVQAGGKAPWADLASTPERSASFGTCGLSLISGSIVEANS